MSMSSLAAQLAGLNDSGAGSNKNKKNVGSILPTSTRHDDAVGRGVHHSVHVGHSLHQLQSPRFAPSLLYDNAKAASDMPLEILWQNCDAALQELSDELLYPPIQVYRSVCQDLLLRQRHQKHKKTSLTHLLTILSTLLPQDVVNCGHVLEYLVRRYNIHVAAADTLLMILLPHCDHPALQTMFHRALELVNIMGDTQQHSWIWLRPYASASSSSSVPPRQVVAHNIVAILQQVCTFTQTVAKLQHDSDHSASILSWSATVLVEGLHHLQTKQTMPATQESVLRVLLPFITKACASGGTRDWTLWGHVVASVVTETMELAPAVKQLLCQSILQGAVSTSSNQVLGDALVAMTAVCLPPNAMIPDPWNATTKTWKECVVMPFPSVLKSMWDQLVVDTDNFTAVLGELLQERRLDRLGVGLILPMTIWAILTVPKNAETVLLTWFRDETLRHCCWKEWTEALSEWLVWMFVQDCMNDDDNNNNKKNDKQQLALVQALLKELRRVDAKACEQGMALALQDAADNMEDSSALRVLLDGVIPSTGSNTKTRSQTSSSSWLPPRVALEHADATIRVQAIEQLLQEYTTEQEDDAMDIDNDDTKESLQVALGRRLASDDHPMVVLAAAKALQSIAIDDDDNHRQTLVENALQGLYQWTSFQKTSSKKKRKEKKHKKKKKDRKESLDSSVTSSQDDGETQESIIVQILQLLGASSSLDSSSLVLEALVAHLEHWNPIVVAAAADSLIQSLDEKKRKASTDSDTLADAKRLVLLERHEFCASLLVSELEDQSMDTTTATGRNNNKIAQQSFRRRSLWVMLQAMAEYVKDPSTNVVVEKVSEMAAQACIYLLSSNPEKLDKYQAQTMQDAWEVSAPHIAQTQYSRMLVSLASLSDSQATLRDRLILRLVEQAKDQKSTSVSPFTVLMEAALQEAASAKAIRRLLSVVTDTFLSDDKKSNGSFWLCVVPTLALMEHSNELVREQALNLLSTLEKLLQASKKWGSLAVVCQKVLEKRSSAAMGGITFLPLSLAAAVRKADGNALRKCLFSLCVAATDGCGCDLPRDTASGLEGTSWLPFGHSNGHIGAAVSMLRAMELAGEDAFPLEGRWNQFGAPILKLLLDFKNLDDKEIPPSVSLMCDCVVSMLKGITVADASALDNVVISTGPSSSGRRQRSYSVGKADGATFIDPYPKPMVTAILNIIESARRDQTRATQFICETFATKVLGRESWATSVFKRFASDERRSIAGATLRVLAEAELHIDMAYFLGLPLDAADVTHLQAECGKRTDGLAALSILADYVRANSDTLMASAHAAKLVKALFESLSTLSDAEAVESDNVEFVRQLTLSALVDLLSSSAAADGNLKLTDKKVKEFVDLLLALNSSATTDGIRLLVSQRAKEASLSLLMSLCSNFPKPVVSSLIPAMTSQIEAVQSAEEDDGAGEQLHSTFASIVPVFWKYASHAGLSFSDLLGAFVFSARNISNHRKKSNVYLSFVRAVAGCSFAGQADATVGAVVACYFAGEVNSSVEKVKADMPPAVSFALQLAEEAPATSQVSSLNLLLQYANGLLRMLQRSAGESPASHPSSHVPPASEILSLALSGSKTKTKRSPSRKSSQEEQKSVIIMTLVQGILMTVNDAMLLETVRKFIRRSERSHTALCLQLWQDMLIVQSTASMTASELGEEDAAYWETLIRVIGEALEQVQALMPLPIFLASATSLIKDGETDDLRAGAIRLVADRAPEVRPGSPEASLFLEMASLLHVVGFLKSPEVQSKGDGQYQLQQAALVAIEHIARAAGTNADSDKKRSTGSGGMKVFLSALQGCSDLFVKICGPAKKAKVDIGQLDDLSLKLLSSAALCTATLVRVTAPKCLALLPKFMNQLVACLSSLNGFVSSIQKDQQELESEARMMQVCLLRGLAAVAESVPQFIYPYMKQLLAPSALPSGALHGKNVDSTVVLAANTLEKSLSKHVPARVLIPVVASSMANLQGPGEVEVLLRMLKLSVEASPGAELAGHLGSLLKAVTATYDFDCELRLRYDLIDGANEVVLALVMKLSENHLRRLFSNLREWKGQLSVDSPEELAIRRVAFWKVSAVLSKELRTIILPCLSTALQEAMDELNLFVSQFCSSKKSEKSKDGTKKRRLDSDDAKEEPSPSFSSNAMLPLQPLLSCLEFAIRADAQDGGKWIRAGDDGERYRSLLDPLGKLLHAKLPADFPLVASGGDAVGNPFQEVVQGGDDTVGASSSGRSTGSVLGCMTALASAAGNEQLWKPLNYAILDACGSRSRAEVRKAGLSCLLSVMKSLGEEYMVLLPECLPVLSELLEDNDEEVAGLAQDCITLGEDLLGESLEDNLR
ncbi:HEAT repeat-containing protein 1 [Seminavis robusta]|uniref:HEAT repeat-containing protein 1 n=1 Tax=Seminavis robusta TaxID=568900 RepID=A0A9N8EAX6_9STRA|nr:HEAT repeat-containing protein 1 [Seminavis robusta]|eukprot:Sro819_g207040.1 HEAT repeat-containing protein 1 (2337) ;mRNA; f:4700-11801